MKNEKKQIVTVVECDTKEQIADTLAELIANVEPGAILVACKGTLAMRKDATKFYAIETTQIVGEDAFPCDVENC